ILPNTPAKPPGVSPSSGRYDARSRFLPISGAGVRVICSTPTTSTILAAPAAMARMPWCTAADPVAQAFSTRVAGLNRNCGSACSTSEAVKSCGEKPALKCPSTISSTSAAETPASASASLATPTTRLSTVSVSNLPNGVCAHPTMLAVMVVLPREYGKRSGHELTTKFVLDVNPDNVVEGLFGGSESEFYSPLGLEIARPAIDNAHDEWIRLAPDPPRHLVSRHPLQGRDFLAAGRRKAGHGEVAARAGCRAIHGRGMDQEADRRARRGIPVPDVLRHRQHRFLAGKRFAQNVGEESGSRLVGKTGTDANGREPDADAVHKTAARIVGQQKFADRLLGAVAQQRRVKELVADRFRKRGAEHRDRRSEYDARLVAAAGKPDRIEQHPRAVEVDPIALVEIELGLAGDDSRQMEDHIGPIRDQLFGDARNREIAGHRIDRKSRFVGLCGSNHVLQRHAADITLAETSVAQQPLGQFAADHAGRAENQNVQDPTPCS